MRTTLLSVFHNIEAMAINGETKISKWSDDRFDRVQLIVIEDFGFQAKHPDAINVAYNVSTA